MKIISLILNLAGGFGGLVAAGKAGLKQYIMRMVWLMAGVAIVLLLGFTAAGFALFGFYQYLSVSLSSPAPAFIVSLTALLTAGIIAVLLKWRISLKPRN